MNGEIFATQGLGAVYGEGNKRRALLLFLCWQAAYAVRLAPGAYPFLKALPGILTHSIFEATAKASELFFHLFHTFATSLSSSSTLDSVVAAALR